MASDGDSGRWGREIGDDDLRGASSAGWETLELDTAAGSSGAGLDPLAGGGGRIVGDPFDGLGPPADLPGLDLDEGAVRSSAPPRPAPPSAPGGSSVPSRASAPRRASGPPAPREPELDPGAIAALADYGPAPASIVGVVPYALLVLTRRRALSLALADLRRLEAGARRDHEEAMIELGRQLHAQRDHGELATLAPQLAAAEEAGRVAGTRTEEWQRARDAADAQRGSLSAKIEEAERAAAPYRDRETKLATQVSVRETDLRRAKARLSRVEIELRNLITSSQPDAARRELLEAELAARRAEVAAAQAQVDELAPKLAEARRELATMLSALNDLTEQRRAVDAAEARSERVHHGVASEAERAYHAAVMELAAQAMARSVADRVSPLAAKAAARAGAALATRTREVQLHEAALSAYDKPSFQRGAAIVGGAALLVVVTLLFVILR